MLISLEAAILVAHLHETSNPKLTAQIDTIGWLFAAFVFVVTTITVMAVLPQ